MSEKDINYKALLDQGYKLGKLKNLTYSKRLDASDKAFVRRFRKDSFIGSINLSVFAFITAIAVAVAFFVAPDSDPVEAKYITTGFMFVVSVITLIVILIRVLGPCKVTHGVATFKHSRRSRNRNSHQLYFVSVYQTTPKKIYVKDIAVNKTQYEEINSGDDVVIIKSNVGGSVYKI